MTDLLLQVFFHYVRPGHLLHDRAFVTLFIGGVMVRCVLTQTLPLLVSATPKRNMIQIQSWTMVLCYPVVVALLYAHTDDWEAPAPPAHTETVPMPRLHDYAWPWASTAMLPLLMLSALPAQILAHSRSLRRKTAYDSNVRAFALAQLIQTASMLVIVYVLGADLGMVGSEQLGRGLHANFFDSLPFDDDHVNGARMLFAMMLAAHLCVCLASARSSWSRLLNLLNVHPLRNVQPPTPQRQASTPSRFMSRASSFASPRWLPPPMRSSGLHLPPLDAGAALEERAWRRFRFLRGSLSGIVLWVITAGIAYFSGVGGVFRLNEKEGEELRFLRSVEIIGILGAIVGFLLPAILWLVLFRIRRPRAILVFQSDSMRRRLSQYLLSPLSALIPVAREEETHTLLPHDEEEEAHDAHDAIPSHENEEGPSTRDEATLFLLARKERALQRQTREYVGTLTQTSAMAGTRCGRSAASVWPVFGDFLGDRVGRRRLLGCPFFPICIRRNERFSLLWRSARHRGRDSAVRRGGEYVGPTWTRTYGVCRPCAALRAGPVRCPAAVPARRANAVRTPRAA